MKPPRLACWLLTRCLPGIAAEVVLGDLLEELDAEILPRLGARRARLWFWRQAMSSIAASWRDRRPLHPAHPEIAAKSLGRKKGDPKMSILLRDLHHGARLLRRSPGFAFAAIATLALGLGASVTVLAALHAVLLEPLPYPDPDRLVVVGQREERGLSNVGYATFEDWRDRTRSFEQLVTIRSWSPTLVDESGAERLPGIRVSWNYFRMLGVSPELGRDFELEEDRPDTRRVAILSHELWQRRYDADPDAVGGTIDLNGVDYRVIGVLPFDFEPLVSAHFYQRAEIWAPVGYDQTLSWACRDCQHLKSLGRLRADVEPEAALADLAAVQEAVLAEHPTVYTEEPGSFDPLHDVLVGDVQPALVVSMLAVGLVLLIACANVGHLLVARASQREGEVAVRTALGASRLQIARQMIAESSLVVALGSISGLALAALLLRELPRLLPLDVPRIDAASLAPEIVGITLLFAVAVTLFFGIAPAFSLLPRKGFRGRAEGVLPDPRRGLRLRRLLVVTDIALAVCLLLAAGLLMRSAWHLLAVDPGFDRERVLTVQLSTVGPEWAEDHQVLAFIDTLLERLGALPGVDAVAVSSQVPLGGNYDSWGTRIEGRPLDNPAEAPSLQRYGVTPGYFRALSISLLRGRLFDERDRQGSEPVVVIGETTASRLWPGEDPLGKRVSLGPEDGKWRRVVGIVGDVRHTQLADPAPLQMYLPEHQYTDSFLVLVVRTTLGSSPLLAQIRSTVHELASDVPLWDPVLLEDLVERSAAPSRFLSRLIAAFAAIALVMTALGLYGLVAFSVARRTREIGIRVALGARATEILGLIFRDSLAPIALGVGLGLAASLALRQLLRGLLFEVSPGDPATHLVVVPLLILVTAASIASPARRAARLEPHKALRHE